ncbi:MAG: amidohydrolase [Roseibium sp.]
MTANTLSNSDIVELTAFRHDLHQAPELSGEEKQTAGRISDFLQKTQADTLATGLGGHGIAAVYDSGVDGPTVMVRAELDGLPIEEINDIAHKSKVPGKGHLCGHDGHMVMLCGAARLLARKRMATGRVILLFQPAEETGQGAAAILADPKFADFAPDISLSLHNLPGLPLGHVGLVTGPANCASRGFEITLKGRTAHASMPETGNSPLNAVTKLTQELNRLGSGSTLKSGFRLVTITHVKVGEPTFGIAPGTATVLATLRCLEDRDMKALCTNAEMLISEIAVAENLEAQHSYHDVFHACTNDVKPVAILADTCKALNVPLIDDLTPMRWSEDFGLFGRSSEAAMFVLGAGLDHPQLHNPGYDFPDDLIPIGAHIFDHAVRSILGYFQVGECEVRYSCTIPNRHNQTWLWQSRQSTGQYPDRLLPSLRH